MKTAKVLPAILNIEITKENSLPIMMRINVPIKSCTLGVKKFTNQKRFDIELIGEIEEDLIKFKTEIIDLKIGDYFYDVKFKTEDNNEFTYLKGVLTVKQNIV